MQNISLFLILFFSTYGFSAEVRLLATADKALDARIESIENAEKEIFIETYYLNNDSVSQGLLKNLVEKKLQNNDLDIRLTIDGFGGKDFSKGILCSLNLIGIPVHIYNPVKLYRPKVSQYRDHRKIWYTEKTVIIGGRNISADTFSNHQWDWDVEVIALENQSLRDTFIDQWKNSKPIDCQKIKPEWILEDALIKGESLSGSVWHQAEVEFGFDLGRFGKKLDKSTQFDFLKTIESAKHSLLMETGFFTPNKKILSKLKEAKLNGVKNEIILNAPAFEYWTEELSNCASLKYQAKILKNDLSEIYYPGKEFFTHGKAILVDDHTFYWGSFNMHQKSYYWNAETWSVIKNAPQAFIKEVRDEFEFRQNNILKVESKKDFYSLNDDISKAKKAKCNFLKAIAPLLHPFI